MIPPRPLDFSHYGQSMAQLAPCITSQTRMPARPSAPGMAKDRDYAGQRGGRPAKQRPGTVRPWRAQGR